MRKIFVGYHTVDGGEVTRYFDQKRGIHLFKCSKCGSTSANQRRLLGNITSDISTIMGISSKITTPGSDREEHEALDTIQDKLDEHLGSFYDRPTTGILGDEVHALANALGLAEAQMLELNRVAFNGFDYLVQGLADNEIEPASGGVITKYSYYNSFYGNTGSLIESSTGFDWTTEHSGVFYSYSGAAELTSADYTVTTGDISSAYISLYADTSVLGEQRFVDWTRGNNMQSYISVDGGSSWHGIKWTDSTNTPDNLHSYFITFTNPGNILKLKFVKTDTTSNIGICGWGVTWLYNPPNPGALLDMEKHFGGE